MALPRSYTEDLLQRTRARICPALWEVASGPAVMGLSKSVAMPRSPEYCVGV